MAFEGNFKIRIIIVFIVITIILFIYCLIEVLFHVFQLPIHVIEESYLKYDIILSTFAAIMLCSVSSALAQGSQGVGGSGAAALQVAIVSFY